MKELKNYETPSAEILLASAAPDFLVFSEETGDFWANDDFLDGFGFSF